MSRTIGEIVEFCELLLPDEQDDYAEGYRQALQNVLTFVKNPTMDLTHINEWLGIIPPKDLQEKLGQK